jgi:hypothetical protein
MMKNWYEVLVKSMRRRAIGRPNHKSKNNIKIYPDETVWKIFVCIELVQD